QANGVADKIVGDDPEGVVRGHRAEPVHGFLDHSLLAFEGEHLFSLPATATRPETRSAPAGQNHRIKTLTQRFVPPDFTWPASRSVAWRLRKFQGRTLADVRLSPPEVKSRVVRFPTAALR